MIMVDKGFRLNVLTEEKAVLDEVVHSIIAPGTEGYLGVLRNHAPLVTELQPGKLTVTRLDRQSQDYAVSGGFLEVRSNTATLLADALEPAHGIDLERAEAAARRARERLERPGPGVDVARAEAALRRALNRLRLGRRAY
jgi:F-type H+-transporting ATPase subunit epsilon